MAALGAALVAATLGVLVYEALTADPHATPRLTVRVDTVVADRSGYTVEYRAFNDGDATAARVLVRGELRDVARVVEQSESTIDFVPARSSRSGGLVFRNDPRAYRVEVRAVGFDRP